MADDHSDEDPFADVWAGNATYAERFALGALDGHAARGLTVVTCMDSRIDPLAVLGLGPGDAKIIRTAGARVTEHTLRSLIPAVRLLGGTRVLVMPHTDCGLVGTDDEVRRKLADATGRDDDDPEIADFRPRALGGDPASAVAEDLARIRSHPLLGPDVPVLAAVYDVATGRLTPVDI